MFQSYVQLCGGEGDVGLHGPQVAVRHGRRQQTEDGQHKLDQAQREGEGLREGKRGGGRQGHRGALLEYSICGLFKSSTLKSSTQTHSNIQTLEFSNIHLSGDESEPRGPDVGQDDRPQHTLDQILLHRYKAAFQWPVRYMVSRGGRRYKERPYEIQVRIKALPRCACER